MTVGVNRLQNRNNIPLLAVHAYKVLTWPCRFFLACFPRPARCKFLSQNLATRLDNVYVFTPALLHGNLGMGIILPQNPGVNISYTVNDSEHFVDIHNRLVNAFP